MTDPTRSLLHNSLSLAGAFVAIASFLSAVILGTIVLTSGHEPNPYLSILTWVVLPGISYLGIITLAAGVLREKRRRHQGDPERHPAHFRVDLNDPGFRKVFYASLFVTVLLLIGTSFGSYQAYRFTESTAFCGSTCHSVMAPERMTHQISPHAEVECAACHVGKTPFQYVEAKLYGLKELASLVTGRYPTPIPTPVHVMQPLRENCTTCHWERKYWGKLHRDYSHYIAANDNERWTLKMNVKVGGMYRFGGEGEGIHWHMKVNTRVSFVATDGRLQKIPWVQVTREDGTQTVYQSAEEPLSEKDRARYPVRQMTCIDCHSRPAHQFKAPILAIDEAMALERIDPALPAVKTKGVELLAAKRYPTQDEAATSIREQFLAFYQHQYPEIFKTQKEKLDRSADVLVALYRQNFFPEMKADWRGYPDNIGHFLADGCFRCHDGLHVDAQGKAISNDCSLCHDIVVQGPPDALQADPAGLEFKHPVDFGVPARDMGKCTACHDGTLGR